MGGVPHRSKPSEIGFLTMSEVPFLPSIDPLIEGPIEPIFNFFLAWKFLSLSLLMH